jgi:ABC-2 type transport system permease protein
VNLRRTRAVAQKEFLHILRDPRSLVMALALPMLMILLFGWALTLDVDRIPTLIYDSDRSPESRDLIARFQGSRYFEVLEMVNGYKPIEDQINRNRCLLGVVIPQDYARHLLAGDAADVQVLLDGSDSNTAAIALSYANAAVQAHAIEVRATAQNRKGGGRLTPAAQPHLRVWYNSELKSKNFLVPGLIALIMMIIASLLTSLTIAREWEMGTMEQLLSTPVRPQELVLGKMSAFFALGIVDMIMTVVAGVFIFRVPLRGSVLFLAFTGCVFLVGALCWGIFLSAAARSQLLAFQAGMLTSFLPAFLLSGFVFAIETMPPVIQIVTYLFPTRYFVSILKGVFLRGVGMEVLWMEALLLMAFAVVVFVAATRKLSGRIA